MADVLFCLFFFTRKGLDESQIHACTFVRLFFNYKLMSCD